jgi:hypothetical protein
MIDETMLLNKLMNVSDEESDLLEWCFFTLDEHQIASCLDEAKVIAAAELRADDAASLLTAVFVKVIVRALRWARLERERERSKTIPEDTSSGSDDLSPAPVSTPFGETDERTL